VQDRSAPRRRLRRVCRSAPQATAGMTTESNFWQGTLVPACRWGPVGGVRVSVGQAAFSWVFFERWEGRFWR
jgi:hypothetical protein